VILEKSYHAPLFCDPHNVHFIYVTFIIHPLYTIVLDIFTTTFSINYLPRNLQILHIILILFLLS